MLKRASGGFFLFLAVLCICAQQICAKLEWIGIYMLGGAMPTETSILDGGIVLLVLSIAFLAASVASFVMSRKK